jgi:dihydroxyacetone kinase-like protein
MAETLGTIQLSRMLHGAVEQIRQNHEMLSRLDAAVGDGDHGTTILRAMEAVGRVAANPPAGDLKEFFSKTAWEVMACDGGSTGPLLGAWFMGMSEATAGKTELDGAGLVAALEAGITKLHKQSRAQIGDKTMMDAFLPALAALRSGDPAGGIKATLQAAAEAAARGAEATKTMRAKYGRARNLGDRVIGHPDPGAVSVSLILKGLGEGV